MFYHCIPVIGIIVFIILTCDVFAGRRNKALKALQFGLTFAPYESKLKLAITIINSGGNTIMPNNVLHGSGELL